HHLGGEFDHLGLGAAVGEVGDDEVQPAPISRLVLDHTSSARRGVRPGAPRRACTGNPSAHPEPRQTPSSRRIGRAGTPTTVVPASTSRVTTAPAPTTAWAPTRRYCRICAPVPTRTASSSRTPPETLHPGLRAEASPTH